MIFHATFQDSTVTVSPPNSPIWSHLELELLHQSQRVADRRRYFYIELNGTLDDLADSDHLDRLSEAEKAFLRTRADVLGALVTRFDIAAGIDVSRPLGHRLADFQRDYVLGRV